MNKGRLITMLCIVVAGCADSHKELCDSDRSIEVWTKYNELGEKEQHTFLRNLTADDMFAFTLAAIPAYVQQQFKGKEVDFSDVRAQEILGMMGGDDLEKWGEKRLAEGRRLTASDMIDLLENSKLPPEWRVSFRGYIHGLLYANPGSPPSDAYEIGLTDEDIEKLKTYVK